LCDVGLKKDHKKLAKAGTIKKLAKAGTIKKPAEAGLCKS
jgi:hypothetical protein